MKLDAPHIFRESAEEVVRSNAPNSQADERDFGDDSLCDLYYLFRFIFTFFSELA